MESGLCHCSQKNVHSWFRPGDHGGRCGALCGNPWVQEQGSDTGSRPHSRCLCGDAEPAWPSHLQQKEREPGAPWQAE